MDNPVVEVSLQEKVMDIVLFLSDDPIDQIELLVRQCSRSDRVYMLELSIMFNKQLKAMKKEKERKQNE